MKRNAHRCPACDVPLRRMPGAEPLSRCPRCDGVLSASPHVARAARVTRPSAVVCPACAGLMDEARAGAAEIAVCARCGVAWLPARAVDALANGAEPALAALAEGARHLARRAARG